MHLNYNSLRSNLLFTKSQKTIPSHGNIFVFLILPAGQIWQGTYLGIYENRDLILTASTSVSCSAIREEENEVISFSSKAFIRSHFSVGLVFISHLHPTGVSQLQNLNLNGSEKDKWKK